MAKRKTKKGTIDPTYALLLTKLDPVRYWGDWQEEVVDDPANFPTLEETHYALPTWLFDNPRGLTKLLELPEELWIGALRNYRDGNHDT